MTADQTFHLPLDPAWFAAISARASRRSFDGTAIDPSVLDLLDTACQRLSAHASPGVRAQLVRSVPEGVFKGIIGSYGAVSGARAFAAFIGQEGKHLEIGYLGEAVVLEATMAGLDTCWIAGSFDSGRTSSLLDLAEGKAVRAVCPLGHATSRRSLVDFLAQRAVRSRSRLPLETIAPGAAAWPGWARAAAEAVRLAPSGKNDQPWRLRLEGCALVLACKTDGPYWTASFDCGIAMLHAELGASHAGVAGRWERLVEPDVARFVTEARE